MTAIAITTPGGPEVLQPRTHPVPAVAAGEVLIRVAAAGVNRPDLLQRQGKYPPPPGAPDTPGLEVAGTIAAVGAVGGRLARSAMPSARWWRAAATPSTAPRRPCSACRCRAGSP